MAKRRKKISYSKLLTFLKRQLVKGSIILNLLLILFLVFNIIISRRESLDLSDRFFLEAREEKETTPILKQDFEQEKEPDRFPDTTFIEDNFIALKDSATRKTQPKKLGTEIEAIKLMLTTDDNLTLVDCRSPDFRGSDLKLKLDKLPGIAVYVLVKFKRDIDYNVIHRMEKYGYTVVRQKNVAEYVGRRHGVFLGQYRSLKYAVNSSIISSVYLLRTYTAKGFYKLNFTPIQDSDKLSISFSLPYTKTGRTLLNRRLSVGGVSSLEVYNEQLNGDTLFYETELKKYKRITLYCGLRYLINLDEILDYHVRVSGEMTIKEYQDSMLSNATGQIFTQPSEKIVFSEYVSNAAAAISPTNTLTQTWTLLRDYLDDEIKYDWAKRKSFFSGSITYTDIKDMYMTTLELGEKKVGACPERSGLEAAILRRLGIASRTSTRLYHIYAEIYLPELGWVTTTAILNEIPLCHSEDERQSYFVKWFPAHPVRLKWEGGLYPAVLF